ncbi:hypothetical protein Ahia01_000338500 [Argonauta hians]
MTRRMRGNVTRYGLCHMENNARHAHQMLKERPVSIAVDWVPKVDKRGSGKGSLQKTWRPDGDAFQLAQLKKDSQRPEKMEENCHQMVHEE